MAPQHVSIWIHTLEPGTHIDRKTVDRKLFHEIVLPFDECAECRSDWGVYTPVVTFSKVERTLRQRGLLGNLGSNNHCYYLTVTPVATNC